DVSSAITVTAPTTLDRIDLDTLLGCAVIPYLLCALVANVTNAPIGGYNAEGGEPFDSPPARCGFGPTTKPGRRRPAGAGPARGRRTRGRRPRARPPPGRGRCCR